ncbi:MAG TPA: hypothetical protein VJ350_07400 [Methanoregula sp.]|nr:hypothetical protein [Methanoregula sp.]
MIYAPGGRRKKKALEIKRIKSSGTPIRKESAGIRVKVLGTGAAGGSSFSRKRAINPNGKETPSKPPT